MTVQETTPTQIRAENFPDLGDEVMYPRMSAKKLERMGELSPGFTAHRAVNSIAVVCAAPPGIRTTVELPQVVAHLGT